MKIRIIIILLSLLFTSYHLSAQENLPQTGFHEIRFSLSRKSLFAILDNVSSKKKFDLPDQYRGRAIKLPPMNLIYTYQIKKWLAFGASASYYGAYQNEYQSSNNQLDTKLRSHYFSITPTVRFDWYRKKLVKLYSTVGIGVCFNIEVNKKLSNAHNVNDIYIYPSLDIAVAGISVGRKVFGLCEIGLGTNGLVKLGIGYRFNNK